MSDSDDAYAAALRLIEKARVEGAERLDFDLPETHALTEIPPEIGRLDKLSILDLQKTQVSDLSPLAGLTGLTGLWLGNTQVSDLSPLAGLTGLTGLWLDGTQVSDLSPLAGLTRLRQLSFNYTPISDLSPIVGLTGLKRLLLERTQVSDLSHLAGLTILGQLSLVNTPVSDLSPLAKVRMLTRLWLGETPVSDLSPLAGLTGLTRLRLDRMQISDLSPLAGLTGLTQLWLNDTQVSDLSPLAGLTGLTQLWLNDTPALDLRPLRGLHKLIDKPGAAGLKFKDTAATRDDPRIAEIAEIEDDAERARVLFEYLEGWVPGDRPFWKGDDKLMWSGDDKLMWSQDEPPTLPAHRPAPLQIEVIEGRLVLASGSAGLPSSDANTRAEQGWHALKIYRESFGESFNIENYAPLPSVLRSFDRALGGAYDPNRQIALGMHGQRIIGLAYDADFVVNLPTGAETELKGFAAAIATLVNRFPDWILYQEDAEAAEPAAQKAAMERRSFAEIDSVIEESANADPELKAEYHDEVVAGTETRAGEVEAKGLVASTSEVARVLLEAGIAEVKSGKAARGFGKQMEDMHGKEFPKILYYAAGFVLPMLSRMSKPLRRLANRYPERMGYVVAALDYLFGPESDAQ